MIGAMMNKVSATVYRQLFEVKERCNMTAFARKNISVFRPDLGYGYYEFKQEELLKPKKNVVLIDKVYHVNF